jgi:hypothetical protein
MTAVAKNPQRVLDKVRECHFFLVEMAIHEKSLETEKFLYCLSAFMSSFRTITNRLYGVTENKLGKAAQEALKVQLRNNRDIHFLVCRTNVELHEDGAVVLQRFTIHAADPIPSRDDPWFRTIEKPRSRFGSGHGVVIRRASGWQFAEDAKSIVEMCHDGLEALEGFIRQVLETDIPDPTAAYSRT